MLRYVHGQGQGQGQGLFASTSGSGVFHIEQLFEPVDLLDRVEDFRLSVDSWDGRCSGGQVRWCRSTGAGPLMQVRWCSSNLLARNPWGQSSDSAPCFWTSSSPGPVVLPRSETRPAGPPRERRRPRPAPRRRRFAPHRNQPPLRKRCSRTDHRTKAIDEVEVASDARVGRVRRNLVRSRIQESSLEVEPSEE